MKPNTEYLDSFDFTYTCPCSVHPNLSQVVQFDKDADWKVPAVILPYMVRNGADCSGELELTLSASMDSHSFEDFHFIAVK